MHGTTTTKITNQHISKNLSALRFFLCVLHIAATLNTIHY